MRHWLIGCLVAALAFWGTAAAQTQCGSYPNNLTNTMTADATQVMGNFNLVRDCANANATLLGASLTSGGMANAQTISPTTPVAAYAAGLRILFKVGVTNTGSTTLNVSALGAKTIKDMYGNALVGGELTANGWAEVIYDGTDMRLLQTAVYLGQTFAWTKAISGATVDFTSLPTGFAKFRLEWTYLQPGTANQPVLLRISQAGSFITTATYAVEAMIASAGAVSGTTGATGTFIQVTQDIDNANSRSSTGWVEITDLSNTSFRKMITFSGTAITSGGTRAVRSGMGFQDSNTAIDGLRLYPASGNFNTVGIAVLTGFRAQ